MNASEMREMQRDSTRALGGGSRSMADILSGGTSGPPIGKKTGYPESMGLGHEHSNWEFLGNRAPLELSRSSSGGPVTSQSRLDHHQYSRQRHEDATRPDQGTHTTRFHRGFARRNNEDIQADEPRLSYEAHIMKKGANHEVARRERLAELNTYNKFNLISGAFDASGIRKGMQGTALPDTHSYDAGFTSGAKATGMHPQMHTVGGPDDPGEGPYSELNGSQPIIGYSDYQGSRLSSFVAKDGKNALAQSHYRFFCPAPSGDPQDARQTSLVHEGGGPSDPRAAGGGNGQLRKQVSNVIGTHRYCDELPSFGVEDQFSKAGYGKDAHEFTNGLKPSREHAPSAGDAYAMPAYFGLVETRRPGLFTPRKQAERMRMMAQVEGGGQYANDAGNNSQQPGSARATSVRSNNQQPGSARSSAAAAAAAMASARISARSGGYGGGVGIGSARSARSTAMSDAGRGSVSFAANDNRAMTTGRSGGGAMSARVSARDQEIASVRALS